MKLKRVSEFGLSLLLSVSSLAVIAVPKAYAATITWTGGTDSNYNFSDAENWMGGIAPTTGDVLLFRSGVTFNDPVNDMTSTVFGGIEFGAIASFECPHSGTIFDFSGSAIRLSGDIIWQNDSCAVANFDSGLEFSANALIDTNASTSGTGISTLSLGANNLTVDTDGYMYIPGTVTGSGSITKLGTGFLSLSGNNSAYTGNIISNSGRLIASGVQALGSVVGSTTINPGSDLSISDCTTDVSIAEPITLNGASSSTSGDLVFPKLFLDNGPCSGGGGYSEQYGRFIKDGNVTLSGNITLGSNVTFGSIVKNNTISGSVSGGFNFIPVPGYGGTLKIGSTTIMPTIFEKTLADNLPSSDVGILAGARIIITGARGEVHVASGGILKGTGTVGNLTVEKDGTLAPGLSPGCINSGNLTLSGNYEVEIGGTTVCSQYDQTKVTGTVIVTDATLNIVKFNNFTPSAGQVYQIIDNDGSDAVTGTFTGLAEGATITVDEVVYRVSYVGGDGNDVTLTVVGVPAAPDTGFMILANNPLLTLLVTITAAGSMLVIAKKYNSISARR